MAGLGKTDLGSRESILELTPDLPECLRDIDLEQECLKVATPSYNMEHTRWCHSMVGEEYARVYSWGHHPEHKVPRMPMSTSKGLLD